MKIFRHLSWLVGGRVLGALLSVISTSFLARILSPADFGVVAAAFVVLSLANVIFDGAFGLNLIQKAELTRADVQTTLTAGVALAMLLVATLVGLSGLIETFFRFPDLAVILVVASVTIPLKAVFAIATAKMQREGHFASIAVISVISQFVAYILLAIPLSLMGAGVWALVAALVAASVLETVISSIVARLSPVPCWDTGTLADIRSTSFFSLANLLNWMANAGSNTIVGHSLGASSLGYYSRGWKLLDLFVHSVATPLGRVLLPSFSRLREQPGKLGEHFMDTLSLALSFYAAASVILTLHAALIVRLALGPNWDATVPVAQILFATLVPRCTFKVTEGFAVAGGKARATAVRQGVYALLMITGCLFGSRYGLVGISIGAALAITIFYVFSLSYAVSISGERPVKFVYMHLYAVALAGCMASVDFFIMFMLRGQNDMLREVLAVSISVLIVAFALYRFPSFLMNKRNAQRMLQAVPIFKEQILVQFRR